VKRIFRVSYRTVLYRLAERPEYGKQIWQRFQYAHVSAYGRSLVREDEPERAPPADFHAAMVTSTAAGEPQRLSADDLVEDRWRRLVRAAVERDLITTSRAAELLGLDLTQTRARIAGWVD